MIKCKVAIDDLPKCGKTICCFVCDKKETCEDVCGVLEDLDKEQSTLGNCEDAFEEEEPTEVVPFENKAAAVIQGITDIVTQKKALEEQEVSLREQLEKAMSEYGVKKFENEQLSITYVDATTRSSIDSKALKKDLPEIAEKYSKVSNVKASIKITVK